MKMGNKVIPKLTYHGYNCLHGGMLEKIYHQVRVSNTVDRVCNSNKVSDYLERWGFETVLEKNRLMGKQDIKVWVEKVNQDDVHNWVYTGGSYGEPLRVPYSRKRAFIRTATFKYFNEACGYHLGDPFLLIRAKNKSPLLKFLRNENIFIPGDISESKISELVAYLKEKKIRVLMGYPTVMYEIALYLDQNPEEKVGLEVSSLISVSEPLESIKREFIHNIFKCTFIDRYSNEEVGLIAQQKEFGGEYIVNKFGVVTEIVDPDTLEPVKEGEKGKVVVTDICNDLIPVVRYDTGDLAVAHEYKNERLYSIKNIEGRVSEQIRSADGKPVSSLMIGPYIYKPLANEGPVYQYQFAQTGRSSYEFRIKAEPGKLNEAVLKEIEEGLQKVLGKEADIRIRFVEDIKPLPSGKRPIYKNEAGS